MNNSHIAWTDDTNNPITVEGDGFYCAKVSAGCTNCYAEIQNKRICGYQGIKAYDFMNMKEPPPLHLKEDMLASWARKKRPRKIFVSSMTDVFGEFVPDEFIYKILDAMVAAPLQIFQVLTKRSKRMREIVDKYCDMRGIIFLPQHIWLMVSVENQETVHRAVDLIATRCIIRGLSVEPLLGDVNLCLPMNLDKYEEYAFPAGQGKYAIHNIMDTKIIQHLDWVIVGGESGHKARVMHPLWAYSLQRQCVIYGIPFFFKQWGEWVGGIWNKNRGIVKLQDGETFEEGYRGKIIYHGVKVQSDADWEIVSVRVGKKERDIPFRDTFVQSDNALLNAKHYFEFPKYLNV